MRQLILSLFLFVEALAHGQGFNERYDAFGWGYAQSAFGIEALSGGYMVISVSSDYDSIAPDVWQFHGSILLTQMDSDGNMVMERRSWRPEHSAFAGWANCCDTIPGGGYVTGGSSEDSTGRDEVYLMRFDALGDTLWTRVFNGPTDAHYWIGRQVKRTADGGFLVVGDTGIDIVINGNDAFAIKTDSLGNEQWRRYYTWPPPRSEGLVSCGIGPANSYYLGGSAFPTDDNGEHWVMRVDTSGGELWEVVWGGPYSEGSLQVITASDGHAVVFSGRSHALDYGSMRPYLAKLDSADGSIMWEKEYGQEHYGTVLFAGKECPDGDLIGAGGTFISQAPNNEMGLLLRTSGEGDSLWMFTYHYQDSVISNGQGRFYDVLPTPDGGFIAAGVTRNPVGGPFPPGYSQDTWVVKVDSLGCIVPGCNSVGITEQVTNLLGALTIFPNPAQGQATVQLTLPPSVAHLPLELSLVGMDGRLLLRERIAGNGQNELALQGVSAGVYHVHIASEGKWLTGGKLVVE
jgi:hypothetical protein